MTKKRVPISAELSTDVMFASDRTCCVCNERGKSVQIHHIDEDPANNVFENLAVLCLQCHDETQITGGFGRKLNAELVTRYREQWYSRVIARREEADRDAVERVVGTRAKSALIGTIEHSEERVDAILEYVNSLPEYRTKLRARLDPELDSGVTARMVQASYDYIDSLRGILVTMAGFYPEGNFDGVDPHRYFSEQVAARFSWHRSHAEPHGPGTGGTIVSVQVVGNVASDVERMVNDMAQSLVGYDDRFDWRNWPSLWNGTSTSASD